MLHKDAAMSRNVEPAASAKSKKPSRYTRCRSVISAAGRARLSMVGIVDAGTGIGVGKIRSAFLGSNLVVALVAIGVGLLAFVLGAYFMALPYVVHRRVGFHQSGRARLTGLGPR